MDKHPFQPGELICIRASASGMLEGDKDGIMLHDGERVNYIRYREDGYCLIHRGDGTRVWVQHEMLTRNLN